LPNGLNGYNGVIPAIPDWGTPGNGGSGGVGGLGNRLFGVGAGGVGYSGQAGITVTNSYSIGGNGGGGANAGGASIFIIVFGEIDPGIIFTLGVGANNGITIVSNYTSIPNTINNAQYVEYLSLQDRSDTNEHLLTEYGYFNAGSISI
jgi:hypothetical protein